MREEEYAAFAGGEMPPWLRRLQARVERTVVERSLLSSGEGVMAGLSGGKDSLCLLFFLSLCRRRPDMDIRLEAATVDWEEAPLDPRDLDALGEFCRVLGLPFRVLTASFPGLGEGGGVGCYGCARKRKELVFSLAAERGCGKVAFGHHLDDAAATALMNLLGRGRAEGMRASRSFFGGKIELIRPLIDIPEASLSGAALRLGLPVASIDCPNRSKNERERLKPLMRELRREFPGCRERLAGLGGPGRPAPPGESP